MIVDQLALFIIALHDRASLKIQTIGIDALHIQSLSGLLSPDFIGFFLSEITFLDLLLKPSFVVKLVIRRTDAAAEEERSAKRRK